ncbi:MAG: NAD-dependent epimerase/dehydratase family protein [Rhizobiales bacterium]|nr:NAD-dependent epimerase/dehydratase family protein [Hyphomicrobiales bacterium]
MRVMVLGAYGMIGSAVLARLHRDGHAVVGVGRSPGRAPAFSVRGLDGG